MFRLAEQELENAFAAINHHGYMLGFHSIAMEASMLILTRRSNENIKIGYGSRVTVLENKVSQLLLGVEAPDDVVILREELLAQEE